MSTPRASSNDHERCQEPSFATSSGKSVQGKTPRTKKSSGVKISNSPPTVVEQEGLVSSVIPVNNDAQARIAERAYELYHRRGGHHGQDLNDWFVAEEEILKEDSQGNLAP